jgi:hypothetical protein
MQVVGQSVIGHSKPKEAPPTGSTVHSENGDALTGLQRTPRSGACGGAADGAGNAARRLRDARADPRDGTAPNKRQKGESEA